MTTCVTCGGRVLPGAVTKLIDAQGVLLVVTDVPAHVCEQCGAKYFDGEISDGLQSIITEAQHGRISATDSVPKVAYAAAAMTKVASR